MTDSTHTRFATALVGRYALQRELGQGGMATVYLARDERHDRDVAIKVLHPDLGAALGGERFLSEIKTTARLQHPHILPLLDSGAADGLLFYVMPYVTGETLRARLARERQLPIDDALLIAREVADALGYAHAQGIVHRDIKPENILLQGGHALVADFGIALAVQQAGGARMTQTGLSLGTPQYMSPEQATGERTIDARADIYALGAVTYEMLVGEPPFTGPSIQAIVARVMTEEPRGIGIQRKAVPPHVEDAVLRALEKLPADRFGTASEFAAALSSGSSTTSLRATGARPAARRSQRALGAAVAASTVMAALALWGWLRPQPIPEVVRYPLVLDSVPNTRPWSGALAISPDGSTIVHTDGPGGALLIRRRDELNFRVMPGTEGAVGPVFSPDGRQLVFFANGRMMTAAAAGGPPVVLVDAMNGWESFAWGEDGFIYRDGILSSRGRNAIARMEARAGAPVTDVTAIDSAAGEREHLLPSLLPDGQGLLFVVAMRDGRRLIAVTDLTSRRHTTLMPGTRAHYAGNGRLLYATADGKLWERPFNPTTRALGDGAPTLVAEGVVSTIVGPVDFAVSRSGTLVYAVEDPGARRELAWVTRDGRQESVDPEWRGPFSSPALSPDGRTLAVSVRDAVSTDVWVKRLPAGVPTRLTLGRENNDEPRWTPDGRSVSYLSTTAASYATGDVWIQSADGSAAATPVLRIDRAISEQLWSRSGEWLVVRTTTPTPGLGDILAARRPVNDSVATPVVASPASEYSPSLSPDGRWMAYVSNESGPLEVYVVPFPSPGGVRRQISTAGGVTPRWSNSGAEIFYLDLQFNLVAASVSTTPTFTLHGSKVLFNAAGFVQTGVSRRNFDVSPDDQRFLMVRPASGTASVQLVVVEHWMQELKAKTKER